MHCVQKIATSAVALLIAACGGSGGSSGGGGGVNGGGTAATFSVGGTVTGLDTQGLVLTNNAGDDLAIAANGAFTFATNLASGSAYVVAVKTQPNIGPLQICTVTNGNGTVGTAAVTNVAVTCASRMFKFLHVANTVSANISAFAINASTGALTAVPGSPFAAGSGPRWGAPEATGKFLYVSNSGSAAAPPTVSGYTVDSTSGALTALAGSPFDLSTPPPAVNHPPVISPPLIHPSGAFGYIALPFANPGAAAQNARLYGGTISSLTGDFTQIIGTPYDLGYVSSGMLFDEAGRILFVATNAMLGTTGGEIRTFLVNSPSGILTPLGSFATGGNSPRNLVLTPGQQFLIVPNATSGTFTVFRIEKNAGVPTGTLTTVGIPVPTATGTLESRPTMVEYNRRNDVLYVVNSGRGNGPNPHPILPPPSIATFRFDRAAGTATAVVPTVDSNGAYASVHLHPSGRFLYQYNWTNTSFQRYALEPATGAPTLLADVTNVGELTSFVFDPSGRYLYLSNSTAGTVSSYSVNATTGSLTLVGTVSGATNPENVWGLMLQAIQ